MDITTAARVKALLAAGSEPMDSDADSILGALITAYSAAAERDLLKRAVLQTTRTEQFDVEPGQRTFWLYGYPVSSITSIKHALDRDFSGATAIDSSNYYPHLTQGYVELDPAYAMYPGPGVAQIVYVGGMAADVTAFVAAYPHIANALDIQIASVWQRKDSLGGTAFSVGQGGSMAYQGPIEWIPHVEKMIRSEARSVL